MFWKNIYTPSRVDTLLDNENVTLQDLMDEDDIIQECKSSNKKLIDFLAKPEIVETLLKMVLDEPPEELDERIRFKYSNIACELISSDVCQITDILASTDSLLQSLYAFLEKEDPLNPLQASFFSKIMGLLISRKSEAMLDFIKSRDHFVGHVLRHLGTSAIMDLLLRLITCIDITECRSSCIHWLNEQKLVQNLIAAIDLSETPERNTNAAQTLCDIIRLGKDSISSLQDGPCSDVLLLEVEKIDSVKMLLCHIFKDDPNESVIVNGLYVLQALLESRRSSDLMQETVVLDKEYLSNIICNLSEALVPKLKDFHQLLINPPKQNYSPMPTTVGSLSRPLGLTRLQVAGLISLLVAANNDAINAELVCIGTVGLLLDLFFQYPWNNFLHAQVERCVTSIITNSSSGSPLLAQLLKGFRLLDRITDAFEVNETQQSVPRQQRLGYLGHLRRIANQFAGRIDTGNKSESNPLLVQIFNELPELSQQRWKTFVENTLSEMNRINTMELAGSNGRSGRIPSSGSDEDDDIGYLNFHMDDNLQKAFVDFQMQQMTNKSVEQFGFCQDDFSELEENIGSPFTAKINSIDFELNKIEDNPTTAAMFEQACNDRIRQFDNTDSDEEWEKEISFSQVSENRHSEYFSSSAIPPDDGGRGLRLTGKNNSDDEEEEEYADEECQSSTDSEDDLNSPQLIRQMHSDKETTEIRSSSDVDRCQASEDDFILPDDAKEKDDEKVASLHSDCDAVFDNVKGSLEEGSGSCLESSSNTDAQNTTSEDCINLKDIGINVVSSVNFSDDLPDESERIALTNSDSDVTKDLHKDWLNDDDDDLNSRQSKLDKLSNNLGENVEEGRVDLGVST